LRFGIAESGHLKQWAGPGIGAAEGLELLRGLGVEND
jgi:hypothetical protein